MFFIHIETFCSGEKSNSMPRPSGSSRRNINPLDRSSGVRITSTEKTCTPDFETISSASMFAARAAGGAIDSKAAATSQMDSINGRRRRK